MCDVSCVVLIICEIQSTRLAHSHSRYGLCRNTHETGEHSCYAVYAVHWLWQSAVFCLLGWRWRCPAWNTVTYNCPKRAYGKNEHMCTSCVRVCCTVDQRIQSPEYHQFLYRHTVTCSVEDQYGVLGSLNELVYSTTVLEWCLGLLHCRPSRPEDDFLLEEQWRVSWSDVSHTFYFSWI